MAAGDASFASLEHTPTWALAVVCFVIIAISVIIEHSFHLLTHWLKRRRKKGLIDAVDKLKLELMLLGFMSLVLAVSQTYIADICIPTEIADIMLPCRETVGESPSIKLQNYQHFANKIKYGNLSSADDLYHEYILWKTDRRVLLQADEDDNGVTNDAAAISDSCTAKGKVSLISEKGIHQLHKFIFVLAVMQILYSVLTMALGRAKMRCWKAWEKETQTTEYLAANDPERFRLTRQTTFGRRHVNSCTETPVQLWTKCFFRQFFHSVAKVDYLTLRHGFITAHLSSASYINFNFQKYIKRSLDQDFKVVIGISPLLWFVTVIFLFVDVYGWYVYLWISYVPLLIVLVLGTKLETIVATMALQINNRTNVVKGTPLVKPSDKLFWFGRPRFILVLLHLTLFLNAFELAFFVWVSIQFGFNSCYHENAAVTVIRVVLAIVVQVLCSYITLPLYALVTQMGSQFRNKVLEERTAKIIKRWHAEVRERRKKQEESLHSPRTSLSAQWSPRIGGSTEIFSSFPRPMSMYSEKSHSAKHNKGKRITEDQLPVVSNEDKASTSRCPPPVLLREMPTVMRPR